MAVEISNAKTEVEGTWAGLPARTFTLGQPDLSLTVKTCWDFCPFRARSFQRNLKSGASGMRQRVGARSSASRSAPGLL